MKRLTLVMACATLMLGGGVRSAQAPQGFGFFKDTYEAFEHLNFAAETFAQAAQAIGKLSP